MARVFPPWIPTLSTVHLRHADPAFDAAGCLEIYTPFVSGSAISFEEHPPTVAEFAARIAHVSERHPWLVAVEDGVVAGFAYASAHRARAAYRWTCETSVYIGSGHRRRGVGGELYTALLELLARQGLTLAVAGITLPNPASVALHEALGFEPVGVYRRIGFKAGAWRDVGWWQRTLSDPGDGQPPEPRPPERP
jgi:L-amino acid N-acyltransferase YncA